MNGDTVSTIKVKNKNGFLICQRVWKAVICQGKIRGKSGNFEVDDKWQPNLMIEKKIMSDQVKNMLYLRSYEAGTPYHWI